MKSMAMTKDILIEDDIHLQFEMSIGCNSLPGTCSSKEY